MRALRIILALSILATLVLALTQRSARRALDPDEPIAADGSLIAGRARTVFDFEPLLGALDDPNVRPDPDDPKDFEDRIAIEKDWTDRSREPIAKLVGPLDASSCEDANRKRLIEALHTYYDARGRQKNSFALRGPRAKAAIEREWSTPLDRKIDAFVRRAVLSGFLHKREVLAHYLPEFAKVVANTSEVGVACPPLKTERRLPILPESPVSSR
jgi:hypothetical protein